MVMHVMFMDMNFTDKWRDHDRDVVHEIVRVDVTLVSCPPHVAPGMTATLYVYCMSIAAPAGMTAFTLWLMEGPALKLRLAVVWVTAASDGAE